MHDAMKNIYLPLFGKRAGAAPCMNTGRRRLVTSEGNMAQENKFRFSGEYMDDANSASSTTTTGISIRDGRWISQDPIMEQIRLD